MEALCFWSYNTAKWTAKRVVEVRSISHWKNDSLYVYIDDMDSFSQSYSDIFMDGLYGNMEHGNIDVHGINYYSPTQVVAFIEAIKQRSQWTMR
jgi:hypothetical protein